MRIARESDYKSPYIFCKVATSLKTNGLSDYINVTVKAEGFIWQCEWNAIRAGGGGFSPTE